MVNCLKLVGKGFACGVAGTTGFIVGSVFGTINLISNFIRAPIKILFFSLVGKQFICNLDGGYFLKEPFNKPYTLRRVFYPILYLLELIVDFIKCPFLTSKNFVESAAE